MRSSDTTTPTLLPSNASAWEKAFSSLTPFDNILNPVIPQIFGAHYIDIPDNFLDWLLMHHGITDLLALWGGDKRTTLTEGKKLIRLRGTRYSIRKVWTLTGFPDATVYQRTQPSIHFPEYEIDLGAVPNTFDDLDLGVSYSHKMQPVRCRLRRIFHGWNDRMLEIGVDVLGGDALIGDYSGIKFKECDVIKGSSNTDILVLGFQVSTSLEVTETLAANLTNVPERIFSFFTKDNTFPTLGIDFDGGLAPERGHGDVSFDMTYGQQSKDFQRWYNSSKEADNWTNMGAARSSVYFPEIAWPAIPPGELVGDDGTPLEDDSGNILTQD